MPIDIGINDSGRRAIADGLARLLADSYTLYLKTHNYHWNVTGPMFNTLHLMFETQYTELAQAWIRSPSGSVLSAIARPVHTRPSRVSLRSRRRRAFRRRKR
jgi:hypothetical protein